jgi:hypothetical protein
MTSKKLRKLFKFAKIFRIKLAEASKEIAEAQAKSLGFGWQVFGHHHDWQELLIWLDSLADKKYRNDKPPNWVNLYDKVISDIDVPLLGHYIQDKNKYRLFYIPSRHKEETMHENQLRSVEIKNIDFSDLENYIIIPDLLSYGEYSRSGLVGEHNIESFNMIMENIENRPNIYYIYGGYGYRGIGIPLNTQNEEILETIDKLDKYYVLDEEEFEEHKNNLITQQVIQNEVGDFSRTLERKFDIVLNQNISPEFFWEKYFDVQRVFNVYYDWNPVEGYAMFPIEEMLRETELEELENLGLVNEQEDIEEEI